VGWKAELTFVFVVAVWAGVGRWDRAACWRCIRLSVLRVD